METFATTMALLNDSNDIFANDTRLENRSDVGDIGGRLTGLPVYRRAPAWSLLMVIILLVTILVIGIIGNSLLLAVIHKEKKPSSTDIYVFHMAVIDILSIFTSTFYFVSVDPNVWIKIGSDWLCRLNTYLQHCGYSVSAILVLSIGIDRYLKVFKPHIPYERTKSIAKWVCVLATVIPATLSLVFIAHSHQNEFGYCIVNSDNSQITVVAYSSLFMIFLVSFLVLGFVYVKIALFLKRRVKEGIKAPGLQNKTSHYNSRKVRWKNSQPRTENLCASFLSLCKRPNTDSNTDEGSARMHSMRSTGRGDPKLVRTTLIMILVTVVFFLTNVVPVVISVVFNRNNSENLGALVIVGAILRYARLAANPILFITGSTSVKHKVRQMLISICRQA